MTLAVGLVGLGDISRYFAVACGLVPEVSLVAVCDVRDERCRAYERAGVPAAASLEALLSRGGLDAIVVSAPNDTHREICTAALSSGVHVCCEKPLAASTADAAAMVAAAEAHERVLLTAFHRNFNEHFLDLSLVAAQIAHVRVRYFEDIREHAQQDSWYLDPIRCGGGCLADNGPNALAMLRELLGPLRVCRVEMGGEGDGVELWATVELIADGGARATVELDWRYPNGELKDLTVRMRDGSLRHVDLLGGYRAFKSSLFHEYVGIVERFERAVRAGSERGGRGLEIAGLVETAYAAARGGGMPR